MLVSDDRDRLLEWKDKIENFLYLKLNLNLNNKRQALQPVSNGVNFLGYIVRRNYILVRKRVVNNMKAKLDIFEKRLIKKDQPFYVKVVYDYPVLEQLRATLASYLGHFKWANSFRLQASLLKKYDFLKRFFRVKDGRLKAIYKVPGKIPSLRLQYRYFKTRFSGDVLLFQVGNYYEFYGDDDGVAGMLGIRKIKKPSGRNACCGFPVRLESFFVEKIMRLGGAVTVVRESDCYLTRVKQRLPKYSLIFQQ